MMGAQRAWVREAQRLNLKAQSEAIRRICYNPQIPQINAD